MHDEKRVDLRYLRYWFRLPGVIDRVEADCTGSTPLTRNRYKERFFLSLEAPLPPLEVQKRIVRKIEELSRKVASAKQLRENAAYELDALAKAYSRKTFEGLNCDPVLFEEVCATIIDNLHSNPVYSDAGNVPCIRSPDVGFGTLNLEGARRTTEGEHQRRTVRGQPQENDIVLVREGGGTGKCAIVLPGQRFSLGQRVMMLRPNPNRVLPRFMLHQLLSPVLQEDYIQELSKGSASPHLNIGALRRFPFILPSLRAQQRIVSELDELASKIESTRSLQASTAAELAALLPAILDRAFRGDL